MTWVQFRAMAMHDSNTGQGQHKVVLKRKLTGPPRLLLGKTKTVNQTGERSDARVLRHQRRMDINGTPKDSTPQTSQDTLGEEGRTLVLAPEHLQTNIKEETEGSHHTRLQNDCSACDEEDAVKEQHVDVSRKTKKTTKEGLGLKRLFPHVFGCVRKKRDKHGDIEIKKENAMTPQSMECTGDDTPGATCHSAPSGTRIEKRRIKTFWFPLVGCRADKGRCLNKSQSLSKDPEARTKTLRKRIQGFLTRRKKTVSSNQFECGSTQTTQPERVEGQVDSHLAYNEDLPRIHEEDIPEGDGDGQVGCPESMTISAEVTSASAKYTECEMTISAEVTSASAKYTECESKEDTSEASCEISGDLTSREDENKLENCVYTQEPPELDLKESTGLSDGVATLTCVVELDSGFRPQIDIAMAMDEVFENGPDEIKLFENTNNTTGPDCDSLAPCKNPSNMSFLTVPVDGCWSPCEANSTDVKPCCNTFDYSLPPEDTSLVSGESLLVLTANSLVRAAIKSALCQLSREIQPPLTNCHRDECAHVEEV